MSAALLAAEWAARLARIAEREKSCSDDVITRSKARELSTLLSRYALMERATEGAEGALVDLARYGAGQACVSVAEFLADGKGTTASEALSLIRSIPKATA